MRTKLLLCPLSQLLLPCLLSQLLLPGLLPQPLSFVLLAQLAVCQSQAFSPFSLIENLLFSSSPFRNTQG
jgi:hypothetical protein